MQNISRTAIVLFALVAVPTASVVWALNASDIESAAIRQPTPTLVELVSSEDLAQQPATIDLEWVAATDIVLDLPAGVITELFVSNGAELHSGDPVLEVDGVTLLAKVGGKPFYRKLTWGSEGQDVAELRSILTDLGFLDSSEEELGTYSPALFRAVKAMETALGVSSPSGVFDPSRFVYVRAHPDEWVLSVGQRLAGGEVVVGVTGVELVDATVRPEGTEERKSLLTKRESVVVFNNREFLLDEFVVREEDLAILADIVDGETSEVDGVQIRLATPLVGAQIPSQAILVGSDGETCVLVGTDPANLTPVPVRSFPSGIPGVELAESSLVGETILANPYSLGDSLPECE